ncbi:hypothetical protein Poli38472_004117 [Pythium oligandrum]|uniref:Uncharacterized protein n=1 Tax=Pythium oligandrum TaxID=41045 RepID=A0A8K1CMM9_PYTOL|nr:hypothetical protein Poli38472_004117 [Pythium oligandrum]|eukprot:TMW66352.1 hypothetical protein Poli38472_004117 [Pythium oligandrum]
MPHLFRSYLIEQVHRAFGNRVIPKYAELLISDDLTDEDRARALEELHDLLSSQERKFQAVDREVMFACTDLTESKAVTVRINAARVISSLVLYENYVDELSTDAMLRAATTLLSDGEEDAVLAGCSIFHNLTISNEGSLSLASRMETLTQITSMINSQPLKLVSESLLDAILGILANVTRIYEGAKACAECAITVPVLTVLKKCTLYDAKTVHAATLIILNAATHDHGKRMAIRQDGVEICLRTLTKVLQAESTFQKCEPAMHNELTRCLVSAVMALSTVEEAKPRIVEFGIEPLVTCLHHKDTKIKRNAMIAINSACESPQGIAVFTDKLLAERDLVIEVFGAKCIPALLRHLQTIDEDSTVQVLDILVELCRTEDEAKEVVQCLHLLDTLAELLLNETKDIRNHVVSTFQLLREHGETYVRRIGKKLHKHGVSSGDFELIMGIEISTFESTYGC